jgi:hypothetical protein
MGAIRPYCCKSVSGNVVTPRSACSGSAKFSRGVRSIDGAGLQAVRGAPSNRVEECAECSGNATEMSVN